MELFIQIRDGQPYEHPIFAENFREVFPNVDTDNLPSDFAKFERVPQPVVGAYEVADGPTYQWVDGIVKDVWTVRQMTDAEREVKTQQFVHNVNSIRKFWKTLAQQQIEESTTDKARQAWADYLIVLDAWVPEDITNPRVPMPPRIDKDGNALTTNAPGTAPDVTG